MRRLTAPFRRLRWKLTLSYTAVTVAALLAVMLAVAFLVFSLVLLPNETVSPEFWIRVVKQQLVPVAAQLLAEDPVDTSAIELLLANLHPTLADHGLVQIGDTELLIRTTGQIEILIIGRDGIVLGATPQLQGSGLTVGEPVDTSGVPGLEYPLQAALAGSNAPERLSSTQGPDYELIVAVPVFDYRENDMHVFSRYLAGAVALAFESLPTESDLPAHTIQLLSRSLLILLLAAGIMGTLFGFLTARGLSNRIGRLSTAADVWSQGDWAEFVEDRSGDELAQLADRLNRMAGQLQNLLDEHQEVAVFEERNRLARDLHDAVTQTLFSASLIAEALPELWENDQEEGRQLLGELRRLARGALAEMRTLLLELRPAALAEANLGDLLRQLAEAVTGRTGVPVDVAVDGWGGAGTPAPMLPPDVHVALYRIAQEALNNVVKHAEASRVTVSLHRTQLAVNNGGKQQETELLVSDDGRGFDPGRVPPNRMGLSIIHERVRDIGATLQIESEPGSGTRIVVVWRDHG